MSISSVSKGLVVYLLAVFACVALINLNNFTITERQFTLFLVSSIFVVGFYIGFDSGKYSSMNGFILGVLSSLSILLMISPRVEMHWGLNFMILVVWVSIAIAGSLLGGFLKTSLTKKQDELLRKSNSQYQG